MPFHFDDVFKYIRTGSSQSSRLPEEYQNRGESIKTVDKFTLLIWLITMINGHATALKILLFFTRV